MTESSGHHGPSAGVRYVFKAALTAELRYQNCV